MSKIKLNICPRLFRKLTVMTRFFISRFNRFLVWCWNLSDRAMKLLFEFFDSTLIRSTFAILQILVAFYIFRNLSAVESYHLNQCKIEQQLIQIRLLQYKIDSLKKTELEKEHHELNLLNQKKQNKII